jgi:anaerobic selenocysteine-containing dehydrogenase
LPEPDEGAAHADAAAADTAAEAADEPAEAQAADAAAQEKTSDAVAEGAEHPAEPGTDEPDDGSGADAGSGDGAARSESPTASERPSPLRYVAPTAPRPPPPLDAYSLRLIADRKLYDRGTLAQHAASMAHLTSGPLLRVNPYDLNRLGLSDGASVSVTSSRASLVMIAVTDPSLVRGTASLLFNRGDPSPAMLIDATVTVTDVRVDTRS